MKNSNNELKIHLTNLQKKKFAKLMLKSISHHYGINSNLPKSKQLDDESEIGIMMEIEKLTGLNNKRCISFEEILNEIIK